MKPPEGLKVVYRDCFAESNSPARVYRDRGEIEINLSRWRQLPPPHRDYILAHEEGHYVLNTSDELAADEYAFNKLAGRMPGSLRNTVHALIDVLPGATSEQRHRMDAAVCRALKYDAVKNNNGEARREYRRLTGRDPLPFFGSAGLNGWHIAGIIIAIVTTGFIIFKKN